MLIYSLLLIARLVKQSGPRWIEFQNEYVLNEIRNQSSGSGWFGYNLMSTAMVDFRWMSKGGLVLDSTGDISLTATPWECLATMVNTRLKAAIDGWKLYQIGADLENLIGTTVAAELELSIQRQVQSALSQDFLPTGSFTVSTLLVGPQTIQVFVYVQNQLVASTTVSA